ncbi:MAG: hypothetical protein NT099_04255 [Candidatus Saganbacteria bacterium]|nr:hypothetical protein [Candidatus Saganbacteria bacterium]
MTRKKSGAPPFVMLRKDLLKDPEWQRLSSSAKIIYIYLRAKFNCKTYSEVSLSYSEVKDMMSTKTISRAFKELQEKGFIEKVKQGGLFGGICSYKFIGPYKDFFYKGYRV